MEDGAALRGSGTSAAPCGPRAGLRGLGAECGVGAVCSRVPGIAMDVLLCFGAEAALGLLWGCFGLRWEALGPVDVSTRA